jgi:hypothetical protein
VRGRAGVQLQQGAGSGPESAASEGAGSRGAGVGGNVQGDRKCANVQFTMKRKWKSPQHRVTMDYTAADLGA